VAGSYLQKNLSGNELNPSAYGLALDAHGDVLVAGASFLLKLSPSLKPAYALALHAEASGVAADAAGNAYVTGTWDPNSTFKNWKPFRVVHALQARPGGGSCSPDIYGGSRPCTDAFVVKVDYHGKFVYSTLLGGSSDDEARGIAVDRAGNAYVTGSTGGNFPLKTPVQADFGGGAADAFLVKIAPDGRKMIYSTYLGGAGLDIATGVAVTPGGEPTLAGETDSADFPISSTGSRTSVSEPDASRIFVSRLPASPRLLVHRPQRGQPFNVLNWRNAELALLLLAFVAAAAYVTGRATSTKRG